VIINNIMIVSTDQQAFSVTIMVKVSFLPDFFGSRGRILGRGWDKESMI
jgi:hypothetical protein